MGKKGDSHYPLCLVWGQTAGFNQLGRMCLCACARVCATERECPASAGMEMSLVMHLPLSLVPDSPSHPCIAHVCRLLPILHPSLSLLPTSILHPQPPSIPPSETKTKSHCKFLQCDFEAVVQTKQCCIAVCVI